jgi:hypothetical protein
MGNLESYCFLPNGIARRVGLKEESEPKVRHIDPEVGVWHTVKLTMKGRTFSAEYDVEVLYDRFVSPQPSDRQKYRKSLLRDLPFLRCGLLQL